MKIKKIQIQQFGKLKNREIFLEPGVNVIYGPNESGKSTLHGFIRGMFFGLPRYRGRASKTDPYTRYEPWERPVDFAGSLEFSVEEKDFWIHRNFYKKDERTELICKTDGEELSVEQGDLQMLLGDISESIYDNTVSIGQLRSETDEGMVRELQNYMANYENGGSADVDVQRAVQYLRQKRREWDGKKKDLEIRRKQQRQQQENQVVYLQDEIKKLKEQQLKAEEEQIRLMQEQSVQRSENERRKQEEETPDRRVTKQGNKRTSSSLGWYLAGIFLLLLAGAGFFSGNWILGAFLVVLGGIFLLYPGRKKRKAVASEKTGQEEKTEKYHEERRQNTDKEIARFQGQREALEGQQEEKNIMLNNLMENLREMEGFSEEISSCEEEIASLDLALETLNELSAGMKKKIGYRLQKRMEEILEEITEGKYSRIFLDEEMKISLCEQNRRIPVYQLSRGTIEQVYFALRMAASQVLCEEPMPVLLDDVFAMYDEGRLKQTLIWLTKQENQVLIFTCHRREMELLEGMGIRINKIYMEEHVC